MSTLPAEIGTGWIHGRFVVAVTDGSDTDREPDAIPAQGSVRFNASIGYNLAPSVTGGPVTIINGTIVGIFDDEGYLCTPNPFTGEPMYRGVKLTATDDSDLAVVDWTWAATYQFGAVGGVTPSVPGHSFSVPTDSSQDLATLASVPSSPGYGLPQAEAAVLRAESAAVSAEQSATNALEAALRAESIAGATDAGVALILGDAGTESGGLLSGLLAPKADIDAMNNALATKAEASDLTAGLAGKADLVGGKVPEAQLPTDALVTDANVAAVVNGAQTGPAIDSRINDGLAAIAPTGGVRAVGKGELVVNVRDFGAVGDNITDDTQAIQNAINSLPNEGGRGGGTVLFDSGNYRITSTLVVANHGVHLRSSGAYTAVITPTESVVGFAILYEIPNSAVRGPRLSDLRINCAGSSAGGLRIAAAYDSAILDNVFVSGLNDGATGIELSPNPGASTLVSQTIVATNVWVSGNRGDRKHTGKCWYLDAVQEAVFIGCKGLAGGETSGTAWHIKGVKGVVLTGCSAAFAATGFVIDSTDRAQSGITIDTPTLESVGQTMVTTGDNMTSYMSFRNPRSQVGETLPAGPITLNNVADSTFELHNIVLTIESTSERIHALTVNKSNVTDNGVNSTVIQWANSLNPYTVNSFAVERASTPYMRMSVAGRSGYHQMQWGASATADNGYQHQYNDGSVNRYVHRVNGAVSTQTWFGYASGASAEIFKIDRNPAVNKAGAYLFINDGSTLVLKQVEVGAIDSGGAGFRSLRIAN